MNLLSDMQWDQ